MVRQLLMFGVGVVLAALPATAFADWFDDFESYDVGSGLHGQGGWEGWLGDPAWDAYVTDAMAYSGSNSLDSVGSTDIVQPFSGYTSGQWTFSTQQYIPRGFAGESYVILLNTYTGSQNWSTQVRFDSALGMVESEFEGAQLPLIFDDWVEFRVDIDLDANSQSIYYDGSLLSVKSWTEGVSGGGALNIGALDIFANGATSIYYDDTSLIPEPASCLLLALGLAVGLRRR
jgi:hypothetical protein